MSTEGGSWSRKSQNLVNVVCEWPLIKKDHSLACILRKNKAAAAAAAAAARWWFRNLACLKFTVAALIVISCHQNSSKISIRITFWRAQLAIDIPIRIFDDHGILQEFWNFDQKCSYDHYQMTKELS